MTRFLSLTGAFSFDVSQFIWMTFLLSIVRCSSRHQPTNRSLQVAILNVDVISGWIIPSVLADYFGTYNVGIPCVISCGILSFTLFGVKTVAGMVSLVLCWYVWFLDLMHSIPSDLVLAVLSRDPSEVGQCQFGLSHIDSELPFSWLLLVLWWETQLMEHSLEKPSLG